MSGIRRWNVIFLIDNNPPNKVALLKRNPRDKYAQNYFTGIGGKVGDTPEYENENIKNSSYRELKEETQGVLSKHNTKLTEFARCIYEDSGATLYYFWGLYADNTLPAIDEKDGILLWVNTNKLLGMKIIPTTLAICQEWSNREYKLNKPFTVIVKQVGKKETVEMIEVQEIKEGLQ